MERLFMCGELVEVPEDKIKAPKKKKGKVKIIATVFTIAPLANPIDKQNKEGLRKVYSGKVSKKKLFKKHFKAAHKKGYRWGTTMASSYSVRYLVKAKDVRKEKRKKKS